MPPESKGRMIRRDISRSRRIASLSKDAALLFVMMIPHYSAHGKMNGSPFYIKGEAVPLLDYFTIPLIKKCLKEITLKTNVKWFDFEGLQYVQSLNWKNHQTLREKRLGLDELPSFPGNVPTTSGGIPPEVELELEGKEEVKEEGEGEFLNFFPQNFIQNICFSLTWVEWEQERKKKKNKLTEAMVKRQANQLIKFSPCQAAKMVDQSLQSGYTGIFELKDNFNGTAKGNVPANNLSTQNYNEGVNDDGSF